LLSARRKLLLADDSPTVRKVVEMFFEEEGYEVVAVGGGADALRELEAGKPPDVLLADAVMPGPDGYELCERVKRDERLSNVPVVLLVGAFEPFNEAEARRVGADTVLTKPFQSIRDLVSKVGSLLGGEPKHEGERPPREESRAGDDAPAELSARPDDGPRAEVRADSAARDLDHEAAHAFDADSALPYADLGADDELIEARPAEAFVSGPASEEARGAGERFVAQEAHAREELSGARFDAREYEHAGANGHTPAAHAHSQQHVTPQSHAEENTMPAQPPFAAAADDGLLDLGQLEPHAGGLASEEEDEFILDLDDEDFQSRARGEVLDASAFDAPAFDESAAYEEAAPPQPDAPSAFAEAAHGEQAAASLTEPQESFYEPAAPVSEPAEPFSESVEQSSEPAVPFAASAHSSSEDASPSSSSEGEYTFDSVDSSGSRQDSFVQDEHAAGETASEFVMQDGPQGFASYVAPNEVGAAPRGFVEPEVVPADVPAPAVVEGEYTDGSVEGDLPKAPAAVSEAPREVESHAEPSTAGYVVSEGHTRVEEPARADRLSPEMVDAIARRVVELMSDKVVREVAWEVVPELAELLIRQKLEEDRQK
jgi:CheY-like chemotaxis protein